MLSAQSQDTPNVSIQTEDFNLADEVALLEKHNLNDGAVVTFTGRVRQQNNDNEVSSLMFEHYPEKRTDYSTGRSV